MNTVKPQSSKRAGALSREHIVQASIELLDSSGEGALTVRALTAHLDTGRGAIYHYVAGKDEMLNAATDEIIREVFEGLSDDSDPRQALRVLALGIFDALAAHPWVGVHLGREPMQSAVFRIWSGFGALLGRMGASGSASADAGAALMNYLLGAAAQYAATFQALASGRDRASFLESVAAEMARVAPGVIDAETLSAVTEHDDRAQFLAGIDIVLAGIEAVNLASERRSNSTR